MIMLRVQRLFVPLTALQTDRHKERERVRGERVREGDGRTTCILLMLEFSQQGLFMHFIWGRARQSAASAPHELRVCVCGFGIVVLL